MKKILAIALALVMVLGLASSALAVSWPATPSPSASPFAIEVIKLGVNADVTGAKYYTVLTDAAAYNYSNIYYAIKLSVPSYANANSYYGNSGFVSGNTVKVTVTYTNVSGKSSETYKVALTDAAQTLWYNGSGFDASWTSAVNNNCGCGDKHILNAVAVGNKEISIKACVGTSGDLKNIKIDGCYSVAEKTFYGVVPCVNCTPVNLSGFLFEGDCSNYGAFFSTNAAGKVTGAYAVDKCMTGTTYKGSVEDFAPTLYGWAPSGTVENCASGSCGIVAFSLRQLPEGAKISTPGWNTWTNTFNYDGKSPADMQNLFNEWINTNGGKVAKDNGVYEDTTKRVLTSADFNAVYVKKDNKAVVATWNTGDGKIKPDNFAEASVTVVPDKSTAVASGGILETTATGDAKNFFNGKDTKFMAYEVDGIAKYVQLGDTYFKHAVGETPAVTTVDYLKTKYVVGSKVDYRLFKQTSATTVNCDSNEAGYLNVLNHMYALLGFTYADVAAGNVYMTKDNLLLNFGFSASVCDTKTWGAYTAAITVATVAEVPATGSVTYVGFAMIVLAIAAAVVTKKVRA